MTRIGEVVSEVCAAAGEVSFRWFGDNLMALTGVRPSPQQWASVPEGLKGFADDMDWWGGCVDLSRESGDDDAVAR